MWKVSVEEKKINTSRKQDGEQIVNVSVQFYNVPVTSFISLCMYLKVLDKYT